MNTIFFLALFFALNVSYYVPQPHYVPVFTQKGDISINTGLIHKQLGYAFTDYLGVYATKYRQNQGDIFYSEVDGGSYRQIEASWQSVGLIPFHKTSKNTFLSIPIAYGWGKIAGNYSYSSENSYTSSFKNDSRILNIQPTFSFKANKYLDFSVFSRFSLYHTKVLETTCRNKEVVHNEFDKFIMDSDKFNDFYIDNGIQFRFGIKNLKLYTQVSSLFFVKSKHSLNQALSFRSGLTLNMNTHNTYRNIKLKINNTQQKIKTKKANKENTEPFS